MLSEFFDHPFRIRQLREGTGGQLLNGFARELRRAGYAKAVARMYIRGAAHFLYWESRRRGIAKVSLEKEVIDDFVLHLKKCRCPRYGRTDQIGGARCFLKYRHAAAAAAASIEVSANQDPPPLVAFRKWMGQRAVCDATIQTYCMYVKELLGALGTDPRHYTARSLRIFVLENGRRASRGLSATKTSIHATRMFILSLIASDCVLLGWMRRFLAWSVGVFHLSLDTCNRRRSRGS
jgi:hypothetical protein